MSAQPGSQEATKGTGTSKRRSDEATKGWGYGGTNAPKHQGTKEVHSTIGNRQSAIGNGLSAMGNRLARILTVVGIIVVAVPAFAQLGGGFELNWSSLHPGTAEPLTGGGFSLQGSVGQAGAGTVSGGGLELTGGFWAATLAPVSEDCGECWLYGDVVPASCLIDVDDLLCVLDVFTLGIGVALPCSASAADIEPCDPDGTAPIDHGDGDVDSDDILAMLAAFAGFSFCDDPCPPGACTADFGSGMECRDGSFFPGGMSEGACNSLGGTYCGDCTRCGDPCDGVDVCSP